MSSFDAVARTWDENPVRAKLSSAVFSAIKMAIPLTPQLAAVDFGCGTGGLSLRLASEVGQVEALDSSREMVAVLSEKAKAAEITNVIARFTDAAIPNDSALGTCDLITTCMVLHHVDDLDELLNAFARWSKPGTVLAIADLVTEDGSFHNDQPGIHHKGFDRDDLRDRLLKHGFAPLSHDVVHVITREVDSRAVEYPVFLNVSRYGDAS